MAKSEEMTVSVQGEIPESLHMEVRIMLIHMGREKTMRWAIEKALEEFVARRKKEDGRETNRESVSKNTTENTF